ncbi:MAG TPA: S41 family peptidase [Gaiellaceae bacterium]|nr:S41 family peptidase [Gaiellaceae bacterium]
MTPPIRPLVVALSLAAAGCGGGGAPAVDPVAGGAADVRALAKQMETVHPDLYATVDRDEFRAAVDDVASRADELEPNELVVELMRLAAMPGVGNGHSGIFPGDPGHRRTLHLYPIRLYEFPDGTYVVDEREPRGLEGARVVAIDGMSYEDVAEKVRPLVPRDNDSSLRGLLPHYVLTAEVLDGLGIVDGVGPAELTLERADGSTEDVTLAPVSAGEYTAAFTDGPHGHYPRSLPSGPGPTYLALSRDRMWMRTVAGRAVVVGYNSILVPSYDVAVMAERVTARVRRGGIERVVIDLRLNGGGNNTTYFPLLQAVQQLPQDRRGRVYVLIGRATFSAAANLAADLDRLTNAVFVGEPTGGFVRGWGDTMPLVLEATGLQLHVSFRYWDFGMGENDSRLAVEPDIPVALTAEDFFAGRDPVLQAALSAE